MKNKNQNNKLKQKTINPKNNTSIQETAIEDLEKSYKSGIKYYENVEKEQMDK